jgi:hypothetical protein
MGLARQSPRLVSCKSSATGRRASVDCCTGNCGYERSRKGRPQQSDDSRAGWRKTATPLRAASLERKNCHASRNGRAAIGRQLPGEAGQSPPCIRNRRSAPGSTDGRKSSGAAFRLRPQRQWICKWRDAPGGDPGPADRPQRRSPRAENAAWPPSGPHANNSDRRPVRRGRHGDASLRTYCYAHHNNKFFGRVRASRGEITLAH